MNDSKCGFSIFTGKLSKWNLRKKNLSGFLKGFRDVTKLQKGRGFIKVMGIIIGWFGKHCWVCLTACQIREDVYKSLKRSSSDIGGWFGYQNYLGLSSFSKYSLWQKGKWGGAIQPLTMVLLVKTLKLEASVWNGKYTWNDRVVF